MLTAALLFGCAATGLVVDQLSKAAVQRRVPVGRPRQLMPGCRLWRVGNTRGSLLPLSTRTAGLVWLGAVAYVAIVLAAGSPAGVAAGVGLGLALGGAAGNLVDRALRGEVLDFIAIGRWRPFNIADVALVVGAFIVPWSLL